MLSRFGFLALLLVPALPLSADSPATKIKVEVLTLSGKPVDRASVIVDFVEGRSIAKLGKKIVTHWEVRSNQEGIARIPALPPGKVRVQVIAKGYQTFGKIFEIDGEEKLLTVKLNPPQAQHSEHQ